MQEQFIYFTLLVVAYLAIGIILSINLVIKNIAEQGTEAILILVFWPVIITCLLFIVLGVIIYALLWTILTARIKITDDGDVVIHVKSLEYSHVLFNIVK